MNKQDTAEMLTPQECAQTMIDGVGFTRGALRSSPTRFANTKLELYCRGYDLVLDESFDCYQAVRR